MFLDVLTPVRVYKRLKIKNIETGIPSIIEQPFAAVLLHSPRQDGTDVDAIIDKVLEKVLLLVTFSDTTNVPTTRTFFTSNTITFLPQCYFACCRVVDSRRKVREVAGPRTATFVVTWSSLGWSRAEPDPSQTQPKWVWVCLYWTALQTQYQRVSARTMALSKLSHLIPNNK
jgi:hypothetical protein